ncbi:MAG: polyphenol oxidase family protein [Acidimicrobiia bacterium]|nr:polyphenol oxidase family protein [Acidimicrobiia bacterium]
MADTLYRRPIGGRVAVVIATERADGDVHPERVARRTLAERQERVAPSRWVMVDQVHGTTVHQVTGDTPRWPLADAGDIIVASSPGVPIAIWAADCAPIVLFGERGTMVAIHAGWRGLAAGVVDVALAQFVERNELPLIAVLGPVVHPCCYEFGRGDLRAVADGVHTDLDQISGRTSDGAVALDVPAAVRAALRHSGPELAAVGPCTGCGGRWFSHRRRGDLGRHALVAWVEPSIGVR